MVPPCASARSTLQNRRRPKETHERLPKKQHILLTKLNLHILSFRTPIFWKLVPGMIWHKKSYCGRPPSSSPLSSVLHPPCGSCFATKNKPSKTGNPIYTIIHKKFESKSGKTPLQEDTQKLVQNPEHKFKTNPLLSAFSDFEKTPIQEPRRCAEKGWGRTTGPTTHLAWMGNVSSPIWHQRKLITFSNHVWNVSNARGGPLGIRHANKKNETKTKPAEPYFRP